MREKVVHHRDPVEVRYADTHWQLLHELRTGAMKVLELLPRPVYLYGSLCRGDVHPKSDIDIVILDTLPSFQIESALYRSGHSPIHREIVQACPNSVPKGHIHVDERITVTIPLLRMTTAEEEFYRFGGLLGLEQLQEGNRVPGIDKRLLLIEPTPDGHIESSIINAEVAVARKLNISIQLVNERIRVLTRRDSVGRTGVYLQEPLNDEESFEERLQFLRDRDPTIRRQWGYRKH